MKVIKLKRVRKNAYDIVVVPYIGGCSRKSRVVVGRVTYYKFMRGKCVVLMDAARFTRWLLAGAQCSSRVLKILNLA